VRQLERKSPCFLSAVQCSYMVKLLQKVTYWTAFNLFFLKVAHDFYNPAACLLRGRRWLRRDVSFDKEANIFYTPTSGVIIQATKCLV
jgi:hypothetical protein